MSVYLLEEYDMLATNNTFSKRVRMAFVHVAREVLEESDTVVGHPLRSAFARAVLSDPMVATNGYIAVVATVPEVVNAAVTAFNAAAPATRTADTAQNGVSNTVILTAVRTLWSNLAGV